MSVVLPEQLAISYSYLWCFQNQTKLNPSLLIVSNISPTIAAIFLPVPVWVTIKICSDKMRWENDRQHIASVSYCKNIWNWLKHDRKEMPLLFILKCRSLCFIIVIVFTVLSFPACQTALVMCFYTGKYKYISEILAINIDIKSCKELKIQKPGLTNGEYLLIGILGVSIFSLFRL